MGVGSPTSRGAGLLSPSRPQPGGRQRSGVERGSRMRRSWKR